MMAAPGSMTSGNHLDHLFGAIMLGSITATGALQPAHSMDRGLQFERKHSATSPHNFEEGREPYRQSPTVPLDASSELEISSGHEVESARRGADLALASLVGLEKLADGWDGPDSEKPLEGTVRDAIAIVQLWPSSLQVPEPDLTIDGHVVLELFRGNIAIGTLEFIGDHKMIYAIIPMDGLPKTGKIDTSSTDEVRTCLRDIAERLS